MISTITTHSAVAIPKNTVGTSAIINMDNVSPSALYFLDLTVTGDGTAKANYNIGDSDSDTFYEPAAASDICTGHTKTTNTGGRTRYAIATPILANKMKILITETGNANPITVTAKLIMVDKGL